MKEKIYSLDLIYAGAPASFVMRTMEDIEREQGPFSDEPSHFSKFFIY